MLMSTIQEVVARDFGVPVCIMRDPSRQRIHSFPRMIAMALSRELTGRSLPEIGREFKRDHTTALHAIRRVKANEFLRENAARLKKKLHAIPDWRVAHLLELNAAVSIADGVRCLTLPESRPVVRSLAGWAA